MAVRAGLCRAWSDYWFYYAKEHFFNYRTIFLGYVPQEMVGVLTFIIIKIMVSPVDSVMFTKMPCYN